MWNETAPRNTIYHYDLTPDSETVRQWRIINPAGQDRPLGRMWHSASIKMKTDAGKTHEPEGFMVYGGINCYQPVEITSEEQAVAYYTWSNLAIEYQYAMEDIWFFSFEEGAWLERKTMQTKRRGVCPQAENVGGVIGPQGVLWTDSIVEPGFMAMLLRIGYIAAGPAVIIVITYFCCGKVG